MMKLLPTDVFSIQCYDCIRDHKIHQKVGCCLTGDEKLIICSYFPGSDLPGRTKKLSKVLRLQNLHAGGVSQL